MSDFFEIICDAVVKMNETSILNRKDNEDFVKEVLNQQKEYNELDLTKEQREAVDELIKANAELYQKEMQEIYKRGFINCASLLKDLDLIK